MVDLNNNTSNIQECDKIESMGVASFLYPLMITGLLGMGTYNIYSIAKVDSYISVAMLSS